MRAARKGNDSMNFVVNSNYVFTANYDRRNEFGTAAVNIWDVLCRNSNFSHFRAMYDQVRLDGVKVKLAVTDAQTTASSMNDIKNITVYTCFDRTGLSLNQVAFLHFNDNSREDIAPSEYDSKTVDGYYVQIGSNIVNATGVKKTQLNAFQRWQQTLSCYPQLQNEKGQYIATSSIRLFEQGKKDNLITVNNEYNVTVNSLVSDSNPVIPFECSSVKFKPILLVGVFCNKYDSESGNLTQYGDCKPVIFNGEFSISVTFKNLKAAR